MKLPPTLKEIKKLARQHETSLQCAEREIERTIERFEEKMARKEQNIRQAHAVKGEELEKRIQEIAKENGMPCYIGLGLDSELESFLKDVAEMGGISFRRPTDRRFRITIFPPGTKEEVPSVLSKRGIVKSPNGAWVYKYLLEPE